MRAAEHWKEYTLIDASDGMRLERWGGYVLSRPDPQVLWKTPPHTGLWQQANAVYHRSASGGGSWEQRRPLPQRWQIAYGDLRLIVSPTGFKHTGIFPEQAVNWDLYRQLIQAAGRPVRVLNLFGYTGGATLACAAAGASVCHVDASKGMVGARKTRRPAALPTVPSGGLWMTAPNSLRVSSGAAAGTRGSLWILPAMAAAPAEKFGSWRSALTR